MDDNLDRILSSDQDVIPSTQFVRNVMVAVLRDASIPAPGSFPWRQVMPGLAICVVALTSLIILAVVQLWEGFAGTGPASITLLNLLGVANRVRLGWVLLALVASFLPTRLALVRR